MEVTVAMASNVVFMEGVGVVRETVHQTAVMVVEEVINTKGVKNLKFNK